MGMILSLGALTPLLIMNPAGIFSLPGLVLLLGTAVTIGGVNKSSFMTRSPYETVARAVAKAPIQKG
jgi:hypothetical protein